MAKIKNSVSHSDAAPILSLLGIEVNPGESKLVNVSLTLAGAIARGENTEANATCKALSLATVGCLLRHCGITRETALETLLNAILEAGKPEFTPDPRDESFAEDFKALIAEKLPKTPVAGRRSGLLIVSPVPVPESNTISISEVLQPA